ncbi:serine hydrolase domain-containing protein [Longitalea luteola]|uniref:serine hydrolase domain-containing protein n=1 Tax=Longitalea luteola TaxID=2812563 RepID=UPI001A95AF87|nr:serine hydrolase domain-containing protein [Longitalea luteola]
MKKLYSTCHLVILFFYVHAQDISTKLDRYLSRPGTFNGSALVVYKGNVLLYKGYGYKNKTINTFNDTATIFRIGSLSKPFTATTIMRLEQDGRLSLHDPVSKYLPAYPEGDSISIEQLLTHHSGIKEYLAVKAIRELPDAAPPISMEQLISYFKDEPRFIKPGEEFPYSNSNYILLACIIEKITGEKFEHVVRKMIFDPLQMHHSGFDFMNLKSTDKSTGHVRNKKKIVTVTDFDSTYAPGCGSMFTTVMDLYKWYKGLYSGMVISDSTRERAFIPRQWKYGYGWFRYPLYGKKCISHSGGVPGFIADMKFFPDDDLCIILLSNNRVGKADADKIAAIVFQKRYQRSGL